MSSTPRKEVLYDKFLESLPEDDGVSSPFNITEKFQSCCHIKTSSGSTHPSTASGGDSNDLTPEMQQLFLNKIYAPVERSRVHGFDYDEKSLTMLLLNERNQDSLNLIGVVGVLGVGKTTLGRLIFTEEAVKQHYVPRIWISMSEEPKSMEKVVERLLEQLGVEDINFISNVHKLPGLLYALHLQLKGKRFLIFLDDVQEKDEYYKKLEDCLRIGNGFPIPNGCGGAVIVTSRNEEAIKKMVGEQNLHRLLPLSDPESCWPIYQTLASGKDGVQVASKEVQEELKKKCGGLPLAARIMGELKHQEKNQKSCFK
ncbi:hypothetical protein REPUB_Repub07fG0242400 [Reevesia pubescens]